MSGGDGVRLVAFDLGDVLVRICRGWAHACEVAGVPAPRRELDDATRAALHDCVCRNETGELDLDAFAAEVAPALGVEPKHVRAVSDAYLLGPYPGACELLDELHAAGVATACLSNTNANHWRLMTDPSSHAWIPLDRMTWRFASHLARARKPDDAIYRHVERETGLPGEAILFFDNLEENVAAARRRGWRAEVIDTAPDEPIAQAREHLRRHGVL